MFRIEDISRTPGNPDIISISFFTSPIRLYSVQSTDDIANDPFAMQLTLQGDGSLTIVDDDTAGDTRIYRIGVSIPQ